MAFPAELVPITLAGVMNLLLGVALMTLNASHRANRVFAAIMLMRAATHLSFLLLVNVGPTETAAVYRTFVHLAIWIDLALLYFLACYPAPRSFLPRGALVPVLIVVAGVVASVLLAATDPPWRLDPAGEPFVLWTLSPSAMFSLCGLVLLRDACAMPTGRARTSTLLLACGFGAVGVNDLLGALVVGGLRPAALAAPLLLGAALVWAAVIVASLALVWARWRTPGARAFALVCAVAALFALGAQLLPGGSFSTGHFLPAGIVRLVLPLFVSYALVRLQVFDLDLRVQRGVGKAFVIGAFVLLFFGASEAAERVISARWGPFVGLVAALLLVVAVRPLERAADRLARRLFPHAVDVVAQETYERVAVYRDLARTAWSAGPPGAGERRVLEAARQRLRIDEAAARGIEAELGA